MLRSRLEKKDELQNIDKNYANPQSHRSIVCFAFHFCFLLFFSFLNLNSRFQDSSRGGADRKSVV